MTAQQRRDVEKAEHEAFLAACPTFHLLAMIGDKWTALVLAELASGPRRHSELRAALPSASQKMLTHTLRCAEYDGLLTRTVTASVPARVDYELTPLGASLLPVLATIKTWAEDHMDEVFAARAAAHAQLNSG
ncbi:winged helix-turn-helix transcriptional regulator [Allokutzneria albata]|uniref:DNA-binding transcriptional regulator, HxlR family n=1 Tax=Allokutzneria albata TaxID=211114 RepID=A0A1G9VG31_ALLAB|nr:helix-turn-helix domain-containing protein [Allokutzneria albata]SDM71043.1 DNA-binding transcriptional regulator, HxlR family [Allokutzneria albata]